MDIMSDRETMHDLKSVLYAFLYFQNFYQPGSHVTSCKFL